MPQPNNTPAPEVTPPRTRTPRGTVPTDHVVKIEATPDVLDELARHVADRVAADAKSRGGSGGGSFGRGSQITISIGVITAVVAFVGLVISVGALVWNLSAEIEKKATKRDVLRFEAATTRLDQQIEMQVARGDTRDREWRSHFEQVERLLERLTDHESRLRVLEQPRRHR